MMNSIKVVSLQETNSISPEAFVESYLRPGIPLIIRNGFPECTAKRWTLDYLKEKEGNSLVHIRKNTNCESYRIGKKYNIEQIPLGHYINLLQTSSKEAQNYYLAATNIKFQFPSINADFIIPPYVEKVHHGPFLWVSSNNHYEFCHVDADDGILCMIQGLKRVKLFHYKYFYHLYPNPMGSLGRTVQSSINCDMLMDKEKEEDYFRLYPKFSEVICEEGVLNPGDLLFIPGFYWHQVTSIQSSISVNIFFGDKGTNNYIQKLIDTRWDAFTFWLLNILEQNKLILVEEIFPELPDILQVFLKYQFKESANEEQIAVLVRRVMEHYQLDKLPTFAGVKRKNPKRLKIRGLLFRDKQE